MISIVKSGERFHLQEGWLSTYWHFSFGHYRDPNNMGWGVLRVLNDDTIAPGGEFPMHPHANFEIITVVLEGEIQHRDSAGNSGTTKQDEVQAMTVGKGVFHSEKNSGKQPLKLLQIWIEPEKKGLPPSWAQAKFSRHDFEGKFCPLVSGKVKAPLKIHQAATIYRCNLAKGKKLEFSPSGEFSYIFVISGELGLNGNALTTGDSAKIKNEKKLSFSTSDTADFLLFDLP